MNTFPPLGYQQLVDTFGDAPAFYDRKDEWEARILEYFPVPGDLLLSMGRPVTRIRAHKLAGHWFQAALSAAYDSGCRRIEYGGIYNYRPKRGNSGQLSVHSWGIAVDLNPMKVPRGADPKLQDPVLIQCFERYGFLNGGSFNTPDAMHFQLCKGY